MSELRCVFFFFFQAEDGIRDAPVTGVQTCALPIYRHLFGKPVCKRDAGGEVGWGKRSASNFRRSTILLVAPTSEQWHKAEYVQKNICSESWLLLFLPPLVFAHQRDHHALNF